VQRLQRNRMGTSHIRLIFKEHTSTYAQETDPRVASGAQGKLPWIYLGAWGGGGAIPKGGGGGEKEKRGGRGGGVGGRGRGVGV